MRIRLDVEWLCGIAQAFGAAQKMAQYKNGASPEAGHVCVK